MYVNYSTEHEYITPTEIVLASVYFKCVTYGRVSMLIDDTRLLFVSITFSTDNDYGKSLSPITDNLFTRTKVASFTSPHKRETISPKSQKKIFEEYRF